MIRTRPRWVAPPAAEVLEVRDGARRHFVPLSDVVWVEAAGNYVELHRGESGLLHRASLAEMQRRLETAGFVRIHRSRLVRRTAVAAIESKPTGTLWCGCAMAANSPAAGAIAILCWLIESASRGRLDRKPWRD